MRVDARDLAVLDQRGDDRPVVATLTCEQRVLAIECQRSDRPLDSVGMQIDAAVIEEQRQPGPAGECVADRIGEFALCADLPEPRLEVDVQVIDDDTGPVVAHGAALLSRGAAKAIRHTAIRFAELVGQREAPRSS